MIYPEPKGFAAAQAAYENQHPDDALCRCHGEHESKGDDCGYNLDKVWACDHEPCHKDDEWWPVRYYIAEGFIKTDKEIKIVLGLFEEHDELTEDLVDATLAAHR